jgi:hypothetical protein
MKASDAVDTRTFDRAPDFAGVGIPLTDSFVGGAAEQRCLHEEQASHSLIVPTYGEKQLACLGVPLPYRPVTGATKEPAENIAYQASDLIRMAPESV